MTDTGAVSKPKFLPENGGGKFFRENFKRTTDFVVPAG